MARERWNGTTARPARKQRRGLAVRASPACGRVARTRGVPVVLSFVRRCLERFVGLEGFDRAMALAGQGFAALLPLLIVVAAISPAGGQDLAAMLINAFHLEGTAAESLRQAVSPSDALQGSVSVVGLLILVVSALSFTRALQRLYERAWQLPKVGWKGNLHGLVWLAGFSVYLSVLPVVTSLATGFAAVVASLAVGSALWLLTPWVLVARRLPPRRLLPQALLTAIGLAVLTAVSAISMPRAVATSAAQFGVIGVAFALLSWLFLVGLVLVTAAAVGAVLGGGPEPGAASSPERARQGG